MPQLPSSLFLSRKVNWGNLATSYSIRRSIGYCGGPAAYSSLLNLIPLKSISGGWNNIDKAEFFRVSHRNNITLYQSA